MIAQLQKQRILTGKQKKVMNGFVDFLAQNNYETGDQIASVGTVTREIGCSVSVLTKIISIMVEEGILEVIPNVGTFFKTSPSVLYDSQISVRQIDTSLFKETNSSQKIIRIRINEYFDLSGEHWRKLIYEFEKHNPDIRVELMQNHLYSRPNPFITEPDIQYANIIQLSQTEGDFLDWIDEETVGDKASFYAPLLQYFEFTRPKRVFPVTFSFSGLMVNRALLEPAGLYQPERWQTPLDLLETCREFWEHTDYTPEDVWGACLPYSFAVGGIPCQYADDTEQDQEHCWNKFRQFLNEVSFSPVPELIMREDFNSVASITDLLRNSKPLFFYSCYWHYILVDQQNWTIFPQKNVAESPAEFGTMGIAINKSAKHQEACIRLGKFIASKTGQTIFGNTTGLLPARKDCTAGDNPLREHYQEIIKYGWWRENFCDFEKWEKLIVEYKRIVADLRCKRISVDDALKGLKELTGNQLTMQLPN